MKVILLERVEGWGALGDVVTVKDGYARNFLLPRQKALRATEANLKVFEDQREDIEARNAKAKADAEKSGDKLDGSSYILIRSGGRKRPALRLGGRPRRGRRGQRRGRQGRAQPGRPRQADQDARRARGEDPPARRGGGHRQHQHRPLSQDEAERQARGENVITSQFDEDRLAAEQQAKDLFEGGAGQALAEAPGRGRAGLRPAPIPGRSRAARTPAPPFFVAARYEREFTVSRPAPSLGPSSGAMLTAKVACDLGESHDLTIIV